MFWELKYICTKFLHFYTKATSDCLPEKNFNRSGRGIMSHRNWPWQWGVNSHFMLNCSIFPLYLYAGPPQEPRPYPSAPFQLSRSECSRNVLWLFYIHTFRFLSSQGKERCGETWLLLVSSWHRVWVQQVVNMCSCTWELANILGSHGAAHSGQLCTVGSAGSSHKVKRQMPILTHSSKGKDEHRTDISETSL